MRARASIKTSLGALALILAGCASMQDTPAQARTRELLSQCPNGNMARVYTDGRWEAYGDPSTVSALSRCWKGLGYRGHDN